VDGRARSELNRALQRLADGERAALRDVLALVHPVVTRYCRALLRGHADADDVAHDALLKLAKEASRFDPHRDALTWVLTLATWECRSAKRRQTRAGERFDTPARPAVHDGASPEAVTSQRQLFEALEAALGELPAADRQALLGEMEADVGDVTTQARFRKRRQRALARLRHAWRKLYGPA
jgi:RNA polymerase sigma-70 factor (ECF subfamily)